MKNKKLLLGDEAFALGAINAGLSGAYAYPGTPSTEILEFVQNSPVARERGIHSHWSSNEKTAMEEALGMSYSGKRATVSMKHVGMNVAADPFLNSAMTGANGGMLVVAADDPSMHSSQNEQDSRFYAKFALVPALEPSNQQEAYDMAKYGFELSEKYRIPVMVRLVTRLSHSRAVVETDEHPATENTVHFPENPRQWVLMPGNSRRRYPELLRDFAALAEESEHSPFNCRRQAKAAYSDWHALGIVASGIAVNYFDELFPGGSPFPVVKVSQYPLPMGMIRELSEECDYVMVIEEGQPFIEDQLRGLHGNSAIFGKLGGQLPVDGELTPDIVRNGLIKAMEKLKDDDNAAAVAQFLKKEDVMAVPEMVMPRPPALCQGCGHRDVYGALNEALQSYKDARVFGDIGCYTLGYLAPFRAIHTVVDMGASITMAKGAADAGVHPAVAIIGDSTFTHSGMTGLLDAINENSPITVIISDNLTTGMTGGQDSQGTGKLEQICLGLGADPAHVRTIDSLPKLHDEMVALFKEEIDYPGCSIIVSRRECLQTAKRHAKKK